MPDPAMQHSLSSGQTLLPAWALGSSDSYGPEPALFTQTSAHQKGEIPAPSSSLGFSLPCTSLGVTG